MTLRPIVVLVCFIRLFSIKKLRVLLLKHFGGVEKSFLLFFINFLIGAGLRRDKLGAIPVNPTSSATIGGVRTWL